MKEDADHSGRPRRGDPCSDIGLADPNDWPVTEVGPHAGGRNHGSHPESITPIHGPCWAALPHADTPEVGDYACGRCGMTWPNAIVAWAHHWGQDCIPRVR